MKLKKDKFKIDDIVYKRNKGFSLNQEDLESLLQGSTAETAFVNNLKAGAYLDTRDLRSALISNKKALKQCGDDLGTYVHCQNTFDSIAASLVTLARLEPTNLEVGWIYEHLKDFNCLGIDHHFLALRHYRAIGERNKSRALESLLRKLYPNHPLIQEQRIKEENNSHSNIEVSCEENANKEKNSAA